MTSLSIFTPPLQSYNCPVRSSSSSLPSTLPNILNHWSRFSLSLLPWSHFNPVPFSNYDLSLCALKIPNNQNTLLCLWPFFRSQAWSSIWRSMYYSLLTPWSWLLPPSYLPLPLPDPQKVIPFKSPPPCFTWSLCMTLVVESKQSRTLTENYPPPDSFSSPPSDQIWLGPPTTSSPHPPKQKELIYFPKSLEVHFIHPLISIVVNKCYCYNFANVYVYWVCRNPPISCSSFFFAYVYACAVLFCSLIMSWLRFLQCMSSRFQHSSETSGGHNSSCSFFVGVNATNVLSMNKNS